jgi:glycosyltransferase involved in cell wall biosynthesis
VRSMRHDAAIRIMKFVTVFESGGTERQFINLGLALDERGFDVRFGCLRQSGRLLEELQARQIPVREYRIRSLYSARAAVQMLRLSRDLAREQVDVVHAYNLYGNVFAVPAAKLAGVPVVIAAVRDCGVYLDPWKQRVQRFACALADLVLVNASGVKDWLTTDGVDPGKIVVIGNGVDLDRFQRESAGTDIRQELGIPADAPLLSTIARLCPTKGFDDVIGAMASIHAERPDAHLIVVGEALKSARGELHPDDSYRERLEARARALGVAQHVHFLGYRDDVPAILRQVTVSVQPSHTEGLSNSILEAMAAGRAVVATPVGGTPEIIHDGVTGVLTPVRDPQALAAAVCRMLADGGAREAFGRAAHALVRDQYSVPAMTDATARVYRDMLVRKRRGAGQHTPSTVSIP